MTGDQTLREGGRRVFKAELRIVLEREDVMGYTHYAYRQKEIDAAKFAAIRKDFEKLIIALDDMDVRLGDGHGENLPVLTDDAIIFNGLANCGHRKDKSIVIPWPSRDAVGGVNATAEPNDGTWFAGTILNTRTCDGDCSYETLYFPRKFPDNYYFQPDEERPDLFFFCCKTAYRPYDIAVTAFLIVAKHHLGDDIKVSSDGEDRDWYDAKQLCQLHLGYGVDYEIADVGLVRKAVAA
jgi:hypothetical protein